MLWAQQCNRQIRTSYVCYSVSLTFAVFVFRPRKLSSFSNGTGNRAYPRSCACSLSMCASRLAVYMVRLCGAPMVELEPIMSDQGFDGVWF